MTDKKDNKKDSSSVIREVTTELGGATIGLISDSIKETQEHINSQIDKIAAGEYIEREEIISEKKLLEKYASRLNFIE